MKSITIWSISTLLISARSFNRDAESLQCALIASRQRRLLEKAARFAGDLCSNGFAAISNTMRWLQPEENVPAIEEERLELMRAVREHFKRDKEKVFFANEMGKRLKF